jgi:hypothetical protein
MHVEKRCRVREEKSNEQKNTCIWCGFKIPPKDRTVEHYVPLSFGGRSDAGNLRMACYSCNHERGAVTAFIKKCMTRLRKMDSVQQTQMKNRGKEMQFIIEKWNNIHRKHRLYQLVFPTTVERILGY